MLKVKKPSYKRPQYFTKNWKQFCLSLVTACKQTYQLIRQNIFKFQFIHYKNILEKVTCLLLLCRLLLFGFYILLFSWIDILLFVVIVLFFSHLYLLLEKFLLYILIIFNLFSHLLLDLPNLSYSPNLVLSFILIPSSLIRSAFIFWVVLASTGAWYTYQDLMSSKSCPDVSGRHYFLIVIHCLWFINFLVPLLQWSLNPGRKEHDIDVQIRAYHQMLSYFLHLSMLVC